MFTIGSNIVGAELDHPDNVGLAFSLVGLSPWDGGNTLYDLTGKTAGAALGGGAAWAGTADGTAGVTGGITATIPYLGYAPGVSFGASWWFAFTFRPVTYPNSFNPVVDDAARLLSGFVGPGGVPSFGYAQWGTLALGGTYRIVRTYQSTGTQLVGGAERLYVNGARTGGGATDTTWSAAFALSFGGNPSGGGGAFTAVYSRIEFGSGRAITDAGAARDYEGSRDAHRDPRFRRLSTRSMFVTAAGVPAACYVPAFAPGWGW